MTIEVAPLDLDDPATLEALVALQRAAYRIEADLLGVRTLPALTESPRQLRGAHETFLGAFEGERLVGAVSWRRRRDLVEIHRLVVDPDEFRRGIGTSLLSGLEAAEPGARRTIVATGAENPPARRLYERHGFTPYDRRTAAGGVPIVTYERRSPA